MSTTAISHQVAVIGGRNACVYWPRGCAAPMTDIGIVDPAESHFYQPLWTLVGGGQAPANERQRTEASVMPNQRPCPADRPRRTQTVTTDFGTTVHYDHLVVSPGHTTSWTGTRPQERPNCSTLLRCPPLRPRARNWQALESRGGIRDGTWVTGATPLVDMTRLIHGARSATHPAAHLDFTNSNGLR